MVNVLLIDSGLNPRPQQVLTSLLKRLQSFNLYSQILCISLICKAPDCKSGGFTLWRGLSVCLSVA